jgi:serine/threonine-protein kinase PknK
VLDVDDFLDSLERVASGGSALDPEVVTRLISITSAQEPLHTLTSRERDVLSLMAEGHTNGGIARRLFLSQRTVETHIASLLAKLGIDLGAEGHRRVLAVLAFLDAQAR